MVSLFIETTRRVVFTGFIMFSIIIISCLGFLVYSNTFFCPFHFDDIPSIVNNSAIRNIYDLQSIWNFLPRRFILYLSLAFNYHYNGLNVFGYHLFNLMVHLGTSILVWWLTLLTLSTPVMKEEKIARHAKFIALSAGLIFVAHPIQTQAVTYIVQRAASMAAFFYLASLCFYIKSRRVGCKGDDPPDRLYYAFSLISALLAMFTKETAITLPLMILLYECIFLRPKKDFHWRPVIPFLLLIFIIPVTMLLTETSAARLQQLHNEPGISSMQYFLTQFRVMTTYVRLVFLPLNQNLDYDYAVSKTILEFSTSISLLFLIIILFWAKRLFLKYRFVSFSIFWFFLTLLPESSFLPIKDVIFEHRLYLPMVGFSMFLAGGAYYLFYKGNFKIMMVMLAMIVAGYSVLTYQRNKIWKDDLTLWNDAVVKSPHKARPYGNRGYSFFILGQASQAIKDYNKAIELDPKYSEALSNRGFAYYNQGKLTQAMTDYNKALEVNPNFAEVYGNRGLIYDKQRNFVQAIADYNKAIAINPNYAAAYSNRGVVYGEQGNLEEAMLDFNKTISIDPDYSVAYGNRGFAFFKQGNFIQALADDNRALELNPKYETVYKNRAKVYFRLKEYGKTLADAKQAGIIK